MKRNRRILTILLSALLFFVVACSDGKENNDSNNLSVKDNPSESSGEENANKNSTKQDENIVSNDNSVADTKSDVDSKTNNSAEENDAEEQTNITKVTDTEAELAQESLKEEYYEKLNSAKKRADELHPTDSSTFALKKMENDRWEIWDTLLNEIYGVLLKELTPEEFEKVRQEQRSWLTFRDDTALEASYQYKGGTQEHLEYVSVLANLTEERCYELVELYMP